MRECEKCEKDLGWYVTRLQLRGNVFAYLCPSCETEYAEHILSNKYFRRYHYLLSVEKSIVHARELPPDSVDPALTEVQREIFECLEMLHADSLRWLGREI